MSELANLPALTAHELDVLDFAIAERLIALEEGRITWADDELATLRSLATAVAEARYSLDRSADGGSE